MRGDEARVVAAFCAHLLAQGWAVRTEVAYADVEATRDGEVLRAEAKGRTSSTGLDVDTMYGQLLRRMTHPKRAVRYAVVVPDSAAAAAQRVPAWVREALRIDLYAVSDEDVVRQVPD